MNPFQYSVFTKRCLVQKLKFFHCFIFVLFYVLCLEISLASLSGIQSVVVVVLVAFPNDSVFGVTIENESFSNVSVVKSLHFEQRC